MRLIGVFDGFRLGFTRIPLYSLIFLCRAVGGELSPPSPRDARRRMVRSRRPPAPGRGDRSLGHHVFAALRGEEVDVIYDLPA